MIKSIPPVALLICFLSIPASSQPGQEINRPDRMVPIGHFFHPDELGVSQNYPNPVKEGQTTTIDYWAMNAVSVTLSVYSTDGKTVLTFENLPAGMGKVIIEENRLQPGTYGYSFIVNGRIIERKKLIVTD